MEYITCAEIQKKFDVSIRRLQQMCKSGEIPGAIKDGKMWKVPIESAKVLFQNNLINRYTYKLLSFKLY